MISSHKKLPTKTKKTSTKRGDLTQSQLFIEKARAIGADEEKSAADEVMGRLAKAPPVPRKSSKKGN
jgi:hypothetical protein